MIDLKKSKIAVLGLARSGRAAAKKLRDLGNIPFVSDSSCGKELKLPSGFLEQFPHEIGEHTEKILNADLIVISPGIPLTIPILRIARERKIPIWSELELGYQILKSTKAKLIAVTGSNGKSTTVSLIQHILRSTNKKSILAGNIGNPLTSFPIEKDIYDFIVLEVSSFQLDTIHQFHPHIAILLNITPDHLDRYDSFEDYKLAKMRIFKNQNLLSKEPSPPQIEDIGIVNWDDEVCRHLFEQSDRYINFSVERKVNPYLFVQEENLVIKDFKDNEVAVQLDKIPIKGKYNFGNISAAVISMLFIGITAAEIKQGILTFTGLEHRLEIVKVIRGVTYINDSKATNSDSVRCALNAFSNPMNLIMGGSDKNEDFSALKPLVKSKVKNLILLGETKEKLQRTFEDVVDIFLATGLEDAVYKAKSLSKDGFIVILSPGCASFDMFKNFEQRGKSFKSIVKKL